MPAVPKSSLKYKFSKATSLGKRKRNAQETPTRQMTPPPCYVPSSFHERCVNEDIRELSQVSSRRRTSSIVDQFSEKLKDGWRWLRRDSAQSPNPMDDLLERASEERRRQLSVTDDAQRRYEGRASIPCVTSYLDSRTVDGPSDYYDTPDYRKSQSKAPSGTQPQSRTPPGNQHQRIAPSNQSHNDVPFVSLQSSGNPPSGHHSRPPSWSPTHLLNRRVAKRRGKQPAQRPEGVPLTDVPTTPIDVPTLPARRINVPDTAPQPPPDPILNADTISCWSSFDSSSNDFNTPYEGRPFAGPELVRPRLDRCLTGRPETNEHFLPSADAPDDFPFSSRPLPITPSRNPSQFGLNTSSSDSTPGTSGGLTPNGRHILSRSSSQHQMTFPMSPATSRHDAIGCSQPGNNYPDLPFDMTWCQSLQVHDSSLISDGITDDRAPRSCVSVGSSISAVSRSPSPSLFRKKAGYEESFAC